HVRGGGRRETDAVLVAPIGDLPRESLTGGELRVLRRGTRRRQRAERGDHESPRDPAQDVLPDFDERSRRGGAPRSHASGSLSGGLEGAAGEIPSRRNGGRTRVTRAGTARLASSPAETRAGPAGGVPDRPRSRAARRRRR